MHTEHLLAIVDNGLCARLCSVVDFVADGQIPPVISPYLSGGSITSLQKMKDGVVHGVCPIVVGEALVWLTERALAISNAHRFCETLLPPKFGVGRVGQNTSQTQHALPRTFTLSGCPCRLYFSNTYNSISRHLILGQLYHTGSYRSS